MNFMLFEKLTEGVKIHLSFLFLLSSPLSSVEMNKNEHKHQHVCTLSRKTASLSAELLLDEQETAKWKVERRAWSREEERRSAGVRREKAPEVRPGIRPFRRKHLQGF